MYTIIPVIMAFTALTLIGYLYDRLNLLEAKLDRLLSPINAHCKQLAQMQLPDPIDWAQVRDGKYPLATLRTIATGPHTHDKARLAALTRAPIEFLVSMVGPKLKTEADYEQLRLTEEGRMVTDQLGIVRPEGWFETKPDGSVVVNDEYHAWVVLSPYDRLMSHPEIGPMIRATWTDPAETGMAELYEFIDSNRTLSADEIRALLKRAAAK